MSEGILSLRFSPTHIELRPASQPMRGVEWNKMEEREGEKEREGGEKKEKKRREQVSKRAGFFARSVENSSSLSFNLSLSSFSYP